MLKWTNNAAGTLVAGISALDTTITLTPGHGARFPVTSAEDYFFATLRSALNVLEVIKVLDRTVDTLTVERGQDGYTPAAFLVGEALELRWCRIMVDAQIDEAATAAVASGTDIITANLRVTPKAYNTGQIYSALIANDNASSAPTINFNALGPKTIKRRGGSAVAVGDLAVGEVAMLHYNGTNMILLNPAGGNLTPGVAVDYRGGTVQRGFLLEDGALASRTVDAALFAAIGTTYGAGDGVATFQLPDSRRRVNVGSGGTASGTLGNAVGNVGGAETGLSTVVEIGSAPGAQSTMGFNATPFNIMQPSMVATKMIKR